MKKILIGFIAIGLLTFVGCKKDDDADTETTDSTETSSDEGSTDTSDEGTDSSTDDDTTETSSAEAKDADGYTYKTVTIGEQEWFAENLKTSKYNDGTPIPNIADDTEWSNDTIGAWSHYDNDNQYDSIYGKLYNWYAVETGKLCPTGWHVPTDAEWTVLTDYLTANGHSGLEGKALKATSGWFDYDDQSGNGTDDYGWNGLPGGFRYDYDGDFDDVGSNGNWWSSSDAWYRDLYSDSDSVYSFSEGKDYGFSVRCLRD